MYEAQGQRLTISDLRDLVERYVPRASLHPTYEPTVIWWPAHELGHLLIAAPLEIGLPFYGLVEGSPAAVTFGPGHEDYAYCCEHAALHVSACLLRTIGLHEAAHDEREHLHVVAPVAAAWDRVSGNLAKVRALVRRRRCGRLPITLLGLERRLASAITVRATDKQPDKVADLIHASAVR